MLLQSGNTRRRATCGLWFSSFIHHRSPAAPEEDLQLCSGHALPPWLSLWSSSSGLLPWQLTHPSGSCLPPCGLPPTTGRLRVPVETIPSPKKAGAQLGGLRWRREPLLALVSLFSSLSLRSGSSFFFLATATCVFLSLSFYPFK